MLEAVAAGQTAFGENYLQEALDKMAAVSAVLAGRKIAWHFIGPIQEQRPADSAPLNICLQVNISGEASKSGVTPGELPELARLVAQLPRLRLRGLMAIPEPETDVARQRAAFAQLRVLFDALRADGLELDTLSMGMSSDMGAAIAEGATIVRIGTAIFGSRTYDSPQGTAT